VPPFRSRGTTIYFRPDDSIFRKVNFDSSVIKEHLEDISYVHGGLAITFHDELKNETTEFSHPDGIAGYLAKLTAEGNKKIVTDQVFSISKDENNTKIEVVLRWTESTDEEIRSYVNGIRTHAGGTHETGLKSAIVRAIKNYMEVHDISPKGV